MKADRLLSALLLLQSKGSLTGRQLAERLEVSQRTVHRDMESLCMAGVPLTALRGANGGWQLDKDWKTQVPGLNEAELRALLMAQPKGLGDQRMTAAAERAMNKLMAALPANMREQAAAMRERLHVDATGWRAGTEDLRMLPVVQDAVAQDCKLTFDYTRADGQRAPRTVDPLGIVSKDGTWYLVARAPHGIRTYRVSRMEGATMLATKFERPRQFNLAAHWCASTAELEKQRKRYAVTVVADEQSAARLCRWCSAERADTSRENADRVTLRVDFESEAEALFLVLGMGAGVLVMEPPELRERVSTEARAMLAQQALNSR
jgi:predicted DNA-binding transcriptional regulator YafY